MNTGGPACQQHSMEPRICDTTSAGLGNKNNYMQQLSQYSDDAFVDY